MEVFSHYGVGTKVYAIERKPDGKVEFTLWGTIFWIPVFPLSSWSAIYAGPLRPDGIKEDGHRFYNEVRVERDALSSIQTVALSILILGLAIAPIGYFIFSTNGRGATSMEMIFVFAACVWPVVVINLVERHRTKLLKGPWT